LPRVEAAPPRPTAPPVKPAPVPKHPLPDWSYDETNGPPMWGKLRPDWAACATGRRQSPIDLQSGLVVNLEPVEFDYRPTFFRVVDTGRLLRIQTGEGLGARIRGERYELIYIELHRPGEARVDGVIHDLSVDLHHRAADGRLAVVSVQFRVGTTPNPVLNTWLSSLPLERGGQYAPEFGVDLRPLLPADPAHFLYVGSLTSPPCTEGVLRVVMKQPMDVSWEQLGVIAQLHPPSARPLQDGFDRRVLESR
jgi:carbonic anhydrase